MDIELQSVGRERVQTLHPDLVVVAAVRMLHLTRHAKTTKRVGTFFRRNIFKSRGKGKGKLKSGPVHPGGNSLEVDGGWQESEKVGSWNETKGWHNEEVDWDLSNCCQTEITVRFGKILHTRDMPTSALYIRNSEKDLSSLTTASGQIIADEGTCSCLSVREHGRQCTLRARVADVNEPLTAASKMTSKKMLAILDSKGGALTSSVLSRIAHKAWRREAQSWLLLNRGLVRCSFVCQ